MQQIVLENNNGKTVRFFSWEGEQAKLIQRKDNRRLELYDVSQMAALKDLDFVEISDLRRKDLEKGIQFEGVGQLKLVDTVADPIVNDTEEEESNKNLWYSLLLIFALACLAVSLFYAYPPTAEQTQEDLKEELARVIKLSPKVKIATQPTTSTVKPTSSKRSLKRIGALAALGSLSKSQQKGGLNLGAMQASKGIGRGGQLGSGGVQTSIYAKGLVAAPLGAGANLKGAGGLGTKGAGGGQAGYGEVSMVGSAGNASIALSEAVTSDGGLDQDMIAAVIQKNLGQVRFCYEQGLQSDPGLAGRVAVKFTIGPEGRVTAANVGSSSLQSSMVESCILMRLRSWAFPKPEGGVSVKVSYPFVLQRVGQS